MQWRDALTCDVVGSHLSFIEPVELISFRYWKDYSSIIQPDTENCRYRNAVPL